jgi:hypothetical protein
MQAVAPELPLGIDDLVSAIAPDVTLRGSTNTTLPLVAGT